MTIEARDPEVRLSRRAALQVLGVAGAGFLASRVPARAHDLSGRRLGTLVERVDGGLARLLTGPVTLPAARAGDRLAICLLVPGDPQGAGPLQLLTDARALWALQAGQQPSALSAFELDPGAAQATYRLLDGLATPRPTEIFAFAATVGSEGLAAGLEVEVGWEVAVRARTTTESRLQEWLGEYHGLVVGLAGREGGFVDGLTYSRIGAIA